MSETLVTRCIKNMALFNLFGKKYDPDEIAGHLEKIVWPDYPNNLADYIKAVRPDALEQARLRLSTHLFVIAASHNAFVFSKNAKFREALANAHGIFLKRFLDYDKTVNLGQAVVWKAERDKVSSELRDRLGILISPAAFDSNEIPYATLLRVLPEIRNNGYMCDLTFGMSHGKNDAQAGVQFAAQAFGISFTKYVLRIDPTAPDLTSAAAERFQISTGHATIQCFRGFCNIADYSKTIDA